MIGLNRIRTGDARAVLATMPDGFIDCVVTSPPYYRLRDYQQKRQLGLEPYVDWWVESLRQVMREVQRVLVPTGTVWLNLGDTYSKGREGAPAKSLLLGPERLGLALISDGWTKMDAPHDDSNDQGGRLEEAHRASKHRLRGGLNQGAGFYHTPG